jgi:hypothetical protein
MNVPAPRMTFLPAKDRSLAVIEQWVDIVLDTATLLLCDSVRMIQMEKNRREGMTVNLRPWIARTLWGGGVALGISIVSGLLSLVLAASGDGAGADAVRGVALVATTVFALSFLALVVILALNELRHSESGKDS